MEKKSLECVDLEVEIGGRTLLGGLSFTAHPGDLVWVRGRNGAGKSTLLRLIAGIIQPDKGHVSWHQPRHHIVYVGHKPAIKPTLTVREMMRFWARLYDSESVLDAALHYFELSPLADIPCEALSAGWKQKLVLSRLILQPATLWLLDEPASHLDDDGVQLLQSLIASRKEQGGIVLLVMHGTAQNHDIKIIDIK